MKKNTTDSKIDYLLVPENIAQTESILKMWLMRYSLPGCLDQNNVAKLVTRQFSTIYGDSMEIRGHVAILKDVRCLKQDRLKMSANLDLAMEKLWSLEETLSAWQTFWEKMKE